MKPFPEKSCANWPEPAGASTLLGSPLAYEVQTLSALPQIIDATILDGTTQPDFTTTPIIVLNGFNAGSSTSGLRISFGGSTVRGFVIGQFTLNGIHITTNGGNVIEGNYIGADVSALIDWGNGSHGIHVESDTGNNTIGGNSSAARNVISGNTGHGVLLQASSGNVLQGNYVGADGNGAPNLGNDGHGILIIAGENTTIGGLLPDEGNVICGNLGSGVAVTN